jgi:hypothetical protein
VSANTPIGGRVGRPKALPSITFKALNGTGTVTYQTNYNGKASNGTKTFDLANQGVTARGCSLTAKRATAEW